MKTLSYETYREMMRRCHIGLLPLSKSLKNSCKTPIKMMECAAESVAAVGGPELYGSITIRGLGILAQSPEDVVKEARKLAEDPIRRRCIVRKAHNWVEQELNLEKNLKHRLWLYKKLWEKRQEVDQIARERLKGTINALPNGLKL